MSQMIPVSEAIAIVEGETTPLGTDPVPIADSVGRILAQDIIADTDLPPFDRSQMDGFALRSADTRDAPVDLTIVGESAAGRGWKGMIKSGEAVRIMTGASVPAGADAVQKLELTEENFALLQRALQPDEASEAIGTVRILEAVEKGKFIVAKGAEINKGERVFASSEAITPQMIASLAAFGYSEIKVGQKPRVAVLATGSEIVNIAETPGPDQIRNSNSPMLTALACRLGGEAHELPLVADDLEALNLAIAEAAYKNDIVVITGGVSVGKYDLTKEALRNLGAEIFFERVKLKPGKPTVFARLGEALIFGLPGNPISAAVTFHLFVRLAMLRMQGATGATLRSGFATVEKKLKGAEERDTFLPAVTATNDKGRRIATAVQWLGSSDFVGFARANSLIFVPAGKVFDPGDVVEVFFL